MYKLIPFLKSSSSWAESCGYRYRTKDSPALRAANVGMAMDIAGTDIARHFADMIVSDDGLFSILKGFYWSRNLLESVQKVLQFQLTLSLATAGFIFVALSTHGIAPNLR